MLRTKHFTSALILTYIIIVQCPVVTFGGPYLLTQEIVKYNDSNYVQIKDEGRKEIKNMIYFGTAISFIWTLNGEKSVIGPFDTLGTTTPVVMASRVTSVKFKNPEQIWVLSDLGHRFSGAALIDLKKQSVVKSYNGVGFHLSPNLQDISYVYPDKFLGDMVFINDMMVWPEVMAGFTKKGIIYPETPNGVTAGDIAVRSKKRNHLVNAQDYKWDNNDRLIFSVRPKLTSGRDMENIESLRSSTTKYMATKSTFGVNKESTVTLHAVTN